MFKITIEIEQEKVTYEKVFEASGIEDLKRQVEAYAADYLIETLRWTIKKFEEIQGEKTC
jgi:hypothetical protein